jgi:hypothetical protein
MVCAGEACGRGYSALKSLMEQNPWLPQEIGRWRPGAKASPGVQTPGPIFTRDIPGLVEYAKLFTTEGTEDTEWKGSLPQMGADGADRSHFTIAA